MKNVLRLSTLVIPALLIMSATAEAQLRKPQLGIYGGGTAPRGDFKEETDIGWHAGALLKIRVTGAIDVRLDGAYNKFGSKTLDFTDATVTSESKVMFAALNAELNLGPDSAAYPGDNSISPYLTAGPAMYAFEFETSCTGECLGTSVEDKKTKLGLNIGAGANIPVRGFPIFAEIRYHRFSTIFPVAIEEGTATMFTASVGFKIR